MIGVDSLDRSILSVLRDSSRSPFVEIAKQVGVTERTVRTRMRRLEDEGIIRGYTIREAGIGLPALVRLKVGTGREIGTLAGEYATWNGIECIYEISGDADLVAVIHVDDTIALRTLLDKMWLAAPGEITSTQTELVLEQY
jgi:Lrp/AsnC family transcriptional regulator, regulator for asnA, asnC and gidA